MAGRLLTPAPAAMSLRLYDICPLLVRQRLSPSIVAGIVATSIELGVEKVYSSVSLFKELVDQGVPNDVMDVIVDSRQDLEELIEYCRTSPKFLSSRLMTPVSDDSGVAAGSAPSQPEVGQILAGQPIQIGFPSSEVSAKVRFRYRTWDEGILDRTGWVESAVNEGALVTGVVCGGLGCRYTGTKPAVELAVDEANRLLSVGCREVLLEDEVGECEGRLITNLVKTMAASQCAVEKVGLILRRPQRQSDAVLLNTSLATAMSLGIERFMVSSENGHVKWNHRDAVAKDSQAEASMASSSPSFLHRYADRNPPSPTDLLRLAFHSMDEGPSGEPELQPYLRQLEEFAGKYNEFEEAIARILPAVPTGGSHLPLAGKPTNHCI